MLSYLEAQITWAAIQARMTHPMRCSTGPALICAACALPIRAHEACVFCDQTMLALHITPGECCRVAARADDADTAAERATGLSDDYRAGCDAALRASDPADVARQLAAIDWTRIEIDDRNDLEW
jgi:hypothetical protein